jgi:two-component sensor histidine kinase
MSITLGMLAMVLLFYFNPITSIVTIFAFFTLIAVLIYIRKTGNYFVPVFIFNVIGLLGCLVVLFGVKDQPHIIDGLWMIINILFVFLVLGYRWGLVFAIIHTVSITLFYLFFLEEQVELLMRLTPQQIYSTSVNVLLSFSIIAYLGWQNIRTNELAVNQLNEAQEVLQVQYNIISKQNEEKTVMLKEIHHRVKNNLQIITSLLRLQSRELENPEAIAKFKDATHRVIAMSMIHEKMYQNDQLSTLGLKEYLMDLSSDLLSSYQSGYPVKLDIECDIDSIGLKSVVPLALILNELISNSLKYAFDDYDNCLISISFTRYHNNKAKLMYKDSGTWKTPSRQGSFGLDLIDSLTNQLEGTMELKTYPETIFEIVFKPTED